MAGTFEAFIRAQAALGEAELVPEISLHLATDSHDIFQAAENFSRPAEQRFPPYWAFAWPGGQAMARYILDNAAMFADARVVDIGSGSGIAAIAAALAGARHVVAADIDPISAAAIGLNAAANGCADRIEATTRDLLGDLPDADVILISDLVYEPELKTRVGAFLEMAAVAGRTLLLGDRMSARQPSNGMEEIARYGARLVPPLSDEEVIGARVWQFRQRAVTASHEMSRPGSRRPE